MSSIISCASESQHGLNARRKATVLFKSKRYEEAISLIDIAIQIDPHCFRNYLNRSICLDALGLYQESLADAILAFNIASESKCLGLRLFIRLAESQIKLENFDEAKRILHYATLFEQQGFSKQDVSNENLKRKIDEIRRNLERNFRVMKESSNQIALEEYILSSRNLHSSNRARTTSGSGASTIRSPETSSMSSSKIILSGSSTVASPPEKHSPQKNSINNVFLPPISPKQRIKTQFPNYTKQQLQQSQQQSLDKFISKKEEAVVREFEEEYIKKFNIEKSKAATLISFLGTSDMRNDVNPVDDKNNTDISAIIAANSASSKIHKSSSHSNSKSNHNTTTTTTSNHSKSSSKSNSINYSNTSNEQGQNNLLDNFMTYSETSSEAYFVDSSQQDPLSIRSSHSTCSSSSSSSSSDDENDEFDEDSVNVSIGLAPPAASRSGSRRSRNYTHSIHTPTAGPGPSLGPTTGGSKNKAFTSSTLGTVPGSGLEPYTDKRHRESSHDLSWRQATPGPRFVLNLDELTGFNRLDEELLHKKP